jgi:hypothetical protein
MQRKNVEAALDAARSFVVRAADVLDDIDNPHLHGSSKTGALRRQSMELTRLLAQMRKSY